MPTSTVYILSLDFVPETNCFNLFVWRFFTKKNNIYTILYREKNIIFVPFVVSFVFLFLYHFLSLISGIQIEKERDYWEQSSNRWKDAGKRKRRRQSGEEEEKMKKFQDHRMKKNPEKEKER